jgi:UDP-N-acetylglucosamine 2-epimerase (non-hydrolysing)
MRVAVVMGTRPEAIKLAPVARALDGDPDFETEIWLTGQHRALLDQVTTAFGLDPAIDLDLMRPEQRLNDLMAATLAGIGDAIRTRRPDLVVLQGDTTTAAAAAIAAFYEHTPVAHVEAGLRSGDLGAPFPEEANRRLVSVVTRWHFAPTQTAAAALRHEGVAADAIHVTGNTVVDALLHVAEQDPPADFDTRFGHLGRFVLVTVHRREHHGPLLAGICDGLAALAADHPDVQFVLPVHPNPNVSNVVNERLSGLDSFLLTEPLDHPTFVHLLERATLVITDSGGLQEEAPVFGVPVLVTRTTTERPEGIDAGTAKLIGPDAGAIRSEAGHLLTDAAAHAAMARATSPYGDGTAARQIVEVLRRAHPARVRPPVA